MGPTENAALVEDTIRGFPSRELVRSRAKVWNDSDLDYAFSRIDELTDSSRRPDLIKWLDELRQERADERRHRELMAATKEAKKKSIQSTPDRPDLVWAIKHLNVAGWIAVVGLCLSSVYIGINLAKVGQVREYFDVQVPPEIQIQKVEVPKFVKVYGGLTPDTEKRVNALFQEHEKRMSELKGELRILEQYGDKAWLYSATSISASANIFGPPPKPPTAAEIRAMIAAEQRSFAASLELLSASLAKPEY